MSTNELKTKVQTLYPEATKIRVRQYPVTYKGSMRGYTTVDLEGIRDDFRTAKSKVLSIVPEPKKTFVDVWNR